MLTYKSLYSEANIFGQTKQKKNIGNNGIYIPNYGTKRSSYVSYKCPKCFTYRLHLANVMIKHRSTGGLRPKKFKISYACRHCSENITTLIYLDRTLHYCVLKSLKLLHSEIPDIVSKIKIK